MEQSKFKHNPERHTISINTPRVEYSDFESLPWVMDLPPWKMQGNCNDADVNIFFPESHSSENTAKARAICEECIVSQECLNHAINNLEKHGIWAGTTPTQRRRVRAKDN